MAISPLFTLPGTAFALIGGWCGNVYMKAQLPVKREQSNARAPILAHLGMTIAGLSEHTYKLVTIVARY